MLIINKDYDLEDLRVYNFEKRNHWYELYDELVTTEVDIESREVYLFATGADEVQTMDIPDIIYDLIKENIIEKSEENGK